MLFGVDCKFMTQETDIKNFDELSGKFFIWIIKYCSATFERPIFLIWYTDTDENKTDRLLTFKNGEIFATFSRGDLKEIIVNNQHNLIDFQNLNPWLENLKSLEPMESCNYDIDFILNSINNNILDIPTIEELTNFINLYGDFINQDDKNNYLQQYAENEFIRKTWGYYYDYIFWPRFINKEKFEAWDKPPLVIDTIKLLEGLTKIKNTFEDKIKLT